MISQSWTIPISGNDRTEKVLRLTVAKARLPLECFITGEAPDVSVPPAGKTPITINWPNGSRTDHFVRDDTNKYMITDRTLAVGDFHRTINPDDTEIVVTALWNGEFLVSQQCSKK